MTEDPKPINGHDTGEAPIGQDAPKTDFEIANARISKMVATIINQVQTSGQVNLGMIVADAALGSSRLQTLLRMLLEPQGDRPAILDKDEFNRLLGEACERTTASLTKPRIQVAVADTLRPRN